MKFRPLIAILLSGALAQATFAQRVDKPLVQTEIEAVRLKVQNDGENAYFLFSEEVLLTATNMRVECDQLEVFATRQAEDDGQVGKFGAIRQIIASGNVRIEQAERTATCQKAVVQPNQERIVLSGSPVVEQPGGRVTTFNPEDEIILDRGNGKISIDTKGPRKLRLTSTAIRDLGFEQELPVPTPPEDEAEEETEAEEEPAKQAVPEEAEE